MLGRILALSFLFLPSEPAFSAEPLSVNALPSVSAGGLTLLLDPVERTPIALLSDPFARLSPNGSHAVLQTVLENVDAAGLPRLRLADALPEHWAQPAIWRTFQRGPDAYTGWGVEVRARDWAGMPATDHRSYRLDPGLRTMPTPTSVTPPGAGTVRLGKVAGGFQLIWNGIAGRIYEVQFTADLKQPFQLAQSIIASGDGEVRFTLPTGGSRGFYRLAEIAP